MVNWQSAILVIFLAIAAYAVFLAPNGPWQQSRLLKRQQFIRDYRWPPGLVDKLKAHHPTLARKDIALVQRALRQFFLAHLNSGRKYIAMPSQVVDDLWHEFILYTKEYKSFCDAAFGQFMHHSPAVVLAAEQKASNEGLRRCWVQCCREESIDPVKPSRLPLLFALDRKLKIPNGFIYHPNCEALRRGGAAGAQCGGDFHSAGIDGSTSGFETATDGSSEGSSSGDSGSDGGGSCGGGGD